ncbi:SipW-dependent-type signal peptide-containing protein [Brevibacterium album]|uniref:SipW-dependent-type signal peptide-containing protein n=1 Tax=Brevibacterium album TaxID=417948 RepID=UPI00042956D1|nr:SipW-dependent-type signal peptide-containing protein [Brevibacterium album]
MGTGRHSAPRGRRASVRAAAGGRRASGSAVRRRTLALRIRALLAGGLVLGAGATSTLAAWTDETTARGEFAASTFSVQANASKPYSASGPWTSAESDVAVLRFDASGLAPGSVRYAPLALRTGTESLGGNAVLGPAQVVSSGSGAADLGAALRYRVVVSDTCAAAAFTSGARYLVGAAGAAGGVRLTTGQSEASPLALPAAAASAPGAPVRMCFELTLPAGAANALQGQTATADWRITAISETP